MRSQKLLVFGTAVFLLLLFFLAGFIFKYNKKEKTKSLAMENIELFVRDYSPTLGPDDAEVLLVEFLDPECESCKDFFPYVKSLMSYYPGKIKLVIRYAPFHGNAETAIRIIEAARMQGKYWEALSLLFKYQHEWGSHANPRPELIWKFLPEIELDITKLRIDMQSPQISKIIEQDTKDSINLGVRATPQFFINGKPLLDFGYEQLKNAIEAEFK